MSTTAVAKAPSKVAPLRWENDSAVANGLTYGIFSEHVRGEARFYWPMVMGSSAVFEHGRWRRLGDPALDVPLEEPRDYNGSKYAAKRWAALHARVVFLTAQRREEWQKMRGAYAGSYICAWCERLKYCRGRTPSRRCCQECYITNGPPVIARKKGRV